MKKRLTEKGARRFIADAHSAVSDLANHPRVTAAYGAHRHQAL